MAATTYQAGAEARSAPYQANLERPPVRRIASLDIVRGIIMVLMAIDHVRVYSAVPVGGLPLGVFFTRWVTHFSAPGFAFLAGTGAFLYGRKVASKRDLAIYLATRGLFLVMLELTMLRLSWTFNLDFAHYNLAGVLWMLGWCMVLLGGLVFLPPKAVGTIGLLLIFAQSALVPLWKALPSAIGKFGYLGGQVDVGPFPVEILYVVVPWIGVMAAGYAFGAIMTLDAEHRRRWCYWIGGVATAAFVIIAPIIIAREGPRPNGAPFILRVLAQRKYPASAMFLLMTLGPTILFIPVAEHWRGWLARTMELFGRVPLFFYLLHIPLIHALACVVSLIREGTVNPWLFANHPLDPGPAPAGYRWGLALLYAVWLVALGILYVACRWYAGVKARKSSRWLRYV
jgi:uncharacterized membrane protein